jgi:hypothetical protein
MTLFRYLGNAGDVLLVAHVLINGNTNFCKNISMHAELREIDPGHARLTSASQVMCWTNFRWNTKVLGTWLLSSDIRMAVKQEVAYLKMLAASHMDTTKGLVECM